MADPIINNYGTLEEGTTPSSSSASPPAAAAPTLEYISFRSMEQKPLLPLSSITTNNHHQSIESRNHGEADDNSAWWPGTAPTWIIASSAVVLIAMVTTLSVVMAQPPATPKTDILSGLTAVVTNDYSDRNMIMFPYPFLKGALLMEPYRESKVTVSGLHDLKSCSLTWSLTNFKEPSLLWTGTTADETTVSTTTTTNNNAWELSSLLSSSSSSSSSSSLKDKNVFYVTPTKAGKYHLVVVENCETVTNSATTDMNEVVVPMTGKTPNAVTSLATTTTSSSSAATTKTSTTTTTNRVLEQNVWVKYVRRELQSLTENDRNEFLDAFHTLWSVNTRDGVEKYGDRYRSIAHFSMVHNDGGGNGICDEFHAGIGFINNHLYLGMYLEQSLRLVNPRVSLHYMEYSKYFESSDFEKHKMNQLDGGSWTELMSSKYFGANDPYTGIILDGRWAQTRIPYLNGDFFQEEMIDPENTFFPAEQESWLAINPPHLQNPYGLLRSPWNYNPLPYLARFNNVNQINLEGVSNQAKLSYLGATCSQYSDFIQDYAVGKPYSAYLFNSEDSVHGNVHFAIGGSGGNNSAQIDAQLMLKFNLTQDHIVYVARAAQKFFKTYVPLKNVVSVDATDAASIGSTIDQPLDDVHPYPIQCTPDPWQEGRLTTFAVPGAPGGPACTCTDYYMQTEASLKELIDLWKFHEADFMENLRNFDDRKAAMKLICSRMAYDGDMASSGAAHDPMFWVVHGAVERLYQRVVFEGVLADKIYQTTDKATCSGHIAGGTKQWLKGYYFEDESVDATTLTNAQLAEILDPTTDSYRDLTNFVYEDATWAWCEGFDDLFVAKNKGKSGGTGEGDKGDGDKDSGSGDEKEKNDMVGEDKGGDGDEKGVDTGKDDPSQGGSDSGTSINIVVGEETSTGSGTEIEIDEEDRTDGIPEEEVDKQPMTPNSPSISSGGTSNSDKNGDVAVVVVHGDISTDEREDQHVEERGVDERIQDVGVREQPSDGEDISSSSSFSSPSTIGQMKNTGGNAITSTNSMVNANAIVPPPVVTQPVVPLPIDAAVSVSKFVDNTITAKESEKEEEKEEVKEEKTEKEDKQKDAEEEEESSKDKNADKEKSSEKNNKNEDKDDAEDDDDKESSKSSSSSSSSKSSSKSSSSSSSKSSSNTKDTTSSSSSKDSDSNNKEKNNKR